MVNLQALQRLGYKFGLNGAHSARSMMLAELREVLNTALTEDTLEHLQSEICDYNLLNKPTVKSRKLTYRHLVDLYGLIADIPIFRVFRMLWPLSEEAQPVLALCSGLR